VEVAVLQLNLLVQDYQAVLAAEAVDHHLVQLLTLEALETLLL
jgi:hypothetical protein